MNWSSGADEATSTAQELPLRRPARPARCQVAAIVPGYPDITTASSDPTSIPNSIADVVTTPRIRPSRTPPPPAIPQQFPIPSLTLSPLRESVLRAIPARSPAAHSANILPGSLESFLAFPETADWPVADTSG